MEEGNPQVTFHDVTVPGMCWSAENIRVHEFPIPGGGRGRWESFRFPDDVVTVNVLAFTESGKLIVVNLYRFPVENRIWELPGGDSQKGETLEAAAERELREETGYSSEGRLERLIGGYLKPALENASFVVFLAPSCKRIGEPQLDPVEQAVGLTVTEVDPQEVIEDIVSSDKISLYDSVLVQALLVWQCRQENWGLV